MKQAKQCIHFGKNHIGRLFMAALVLLVAAITTPLLQAGNVMVLYNFGGAADGGDPYAPLIRDFAGNLYSTGGYGGTYYAGVVYKVDTSGKETVLYNFTGGADGAYPESPVVRDKEGNLYGTTTQGGSAGAGVVFKVDTNGNETVLHNFIGGKDGIIPAGGLMLDAAGNLYGATGQGGSYNDGVLFKIDSNRQGDDPPHLYGPYKRWQVPHLHNCGKRSGWRPLWHHSGRRRRG